MQSDMQNRLFRFLVTVLHRIPFETILWNRHTFDINEHTFEVFLQALNETWAKLSRYSVAWYEELDDKDLLLHVITKLDYLLRCYGIQQHAVHLPSYRQFLLLEFETQRNGRDPQEMENSDAYETSHSIGDSFFTAVRLVDGIPTEQFDRIAASLTDICNLIVSERLTALPIQPLAALHSNLEKLLESSYESDVIYNLNKLFFQFLHQAPRETAPAYSTTRQHQEATLRKLIDFSKTHQRGRSEMAEMASGLKLVDHAMLDQRIGADDYNAAVTKQKNVPCTYEELDLREFTWILDGCDPNPHLYDPYDIQDVLWLYERDDGLNLWRIKRELKHTIRDG